MAKIDIEAQARALLDRERHGSKDFDALKALLDELVAFTEEHAKKLSTATKVRISTAITNIKNIVEVEQANIKALSEATQEYSTLNAQFEKYDQLCEYWGETIDLDGFASNDTDLFPTDFTVEWEAYTDEQKQYIAYALEVAETFGIDLKELSGQPFSALQGFIQEKERAMDQQAFIINRANGVYDGQIVKEDKEQMKPIQTIFTTLQTLFPDIDTESFYTIETRIQNELTTIEAQIRFLEPIAELYIADKAKLAEAVTLESQAKAELDEAQKAVDKYRTKDGKPVLDHQTIIDAFYLANPDEVGKEIDPEKFLKYLEDNYSQKTYPNFTKVKGYYEAKIRQIKCQSAYAKAALQLKSAQDTFALYTTDYEAELEGEKARLKDIRQLQNDLHKQTPVLTDLIKRYGITGATLQEQVTNLTKKIDDIQHAEKAAAPAKGSHSKFVEYGKPGFTLEPSATLAAGNSVNKCVIHQDKNPSKEMTLDEFHKHLQEEYGYSPAVSGDRVVFARPVIGKRDWRTRLKNYLTGKGKTSEYYVDRMEMVSMSLQDILKNPGAAFDAALADAKLAAKAAGVTAPMPGAKNKFTNLLKSDPDKALKLLLSLRCATNSQDLESIFLTLNQDVHTPAKFPGKGFHYHAPHIKQQQYGHLFWKTTELEFDTTVDNPYVDLPAKSSPLFNRQNRGNKHGQDAIAVDSNQLVQGRSHRRKKDKSTPGGTPGGRE